MEERFDRVGGSHHFDLIDSALRCKLQLDNDTQKLKQKRTNKQMNEYT
jgi:hypothetical protein